MEKSYTVKGITTYKRMKHGMNDGYTANVYLGKKKIGFASKYPDDGIFMFDAGDKEKKSLLLAMPQEIRLSEFPFERFISELVKKTLAFNKVKSYRKNINLLVVIENGCLCKIEYTGFVRTKTIEVYMKERPDVIVLNRLSDDEIWEALDTYLIV